MVEVCGKGHLGLIFYVGQCVLREWFVGGGGLYGYFGEQGLPVGVQEYLDVFYRGCFTYLSRRFVPKWDSPKGDGGYNIFDGGTYRRGRVALCGLYG